MTGKRPDGSRTLYAKGEHGEDFYTERVADVSSYIAQLSRASISGSGRWAGSRSRCTPTVASSAGPSERNHLITMEMHLFAGVERSRFGPQTATARRLVRTRSVPMVTPTTPRTTCATGPTESTDGRTAAVEGGPRPASRWTPAQSTA